MKNKSLNIIFIAVILLVVMSSFINTNNTYESDISNDILKNANIVEYKDIDNELFNQSNQGYKKVNIYIEDNIISFNDSNTITELDYSIINKINNSDKSTWNLVTNNLVEEYIYEDNIITINDSNIDTITFSFIYDNEEYQLALVKEDDIYILKNAYIKLIHGNINSLWYQFYYDINDAIKAANNNDYIIIYNDIEIDNTLNINKSINILSDTSNIYSITTTSDYLFNITNNKAKLNISNILINTNSFVKGKYNKVKISLDNSKVIYNNKIYSNKEFKEHIKQSDKNTFIKASL